MRGFIHKGLRVPFGIAWPPSAHSSHIA